VKIISALKPTNEVGVPFSDSVADVNRELDPRRLGDHIDRLYRAACALTGSRVEADDLVQDTYARVLSRPRLLRSDDDLGYLLQIMRNLFLDQRRAAARRPVEAVDPDDLERMERSVTAGPQAALETREVFAAVSALPDDFRDVIVAVDIVGLSYKEAAKSLKIAEGTVMSRLYRARGRVAKELGAPA
jgi:RNA polymerase sigma-70 factor, ECF subfamily